MSNKPTDHDDALAKAEAAYADTLEAMAQAYREIAAVTYDADRVKIEPDAEVSVDPEGAWVAAWVFVSKKG